MLSGLDPERIHSREILTSIVYCLFFSQDVISILCCSCVQANSM